MVLSVAQYSIAPQSRTFSRMLGNTKILSKRSDWLVAFVLIQHLSGVLSMDALSFLFKQLTA